MASIEGVVGAPKPRASVVIVGLGNPGREYEQTRHNIGFDAVDRYARLIGAAWGGVSRGAQTADGRVGATRVTLVKPMTYMNLSGEPLMQVLKYRPHPAGDVLVVVDDIHLPVGKLRLRAGGSDGGHNGLKSVTAHLHTAQYPRLRIGVGEPGSAARQVDYVLGRFSRSEWKEMDEEVLDRCTAAMQAWAEQGIDAAMNGFNG